MRYELKTPYRDGTTHVIGLRNRWVAAAIILLGTTALALLLVGSAPTGTIRAGALDVSVVSLTSLSVYLLPLIALLLSFDALVGEFERGTMLLLLTYPVARWQVVMGNFLPHDDTADRGCCWLWRRCCDYGVVYG